MTTRRISFSTLLNDDSVDRYFDFNSTAKNPALHKCDVAIRLKHCWLSSTLIENLNSENEENSSLVTENQMECRRFIVLALKSCNSLTVFQFLLETISRNVFSESSDKQKLMSLNSLAIQDHYLREIFLSSENNWFY